MVRWAAARWHCRHQSPEHGIHRTPCFEDLRNPRLKRWQFALAVAASVLLAGGVLTALRLREWAAPPTEEVLHAIPLTSFPGNQSQPSFSPDGSQVAFSWDGEKQDNPDIYVKRIDPGPPQRLTYDSAADISPAWSPNGRWIAFLRAKQMGRYAVVLISPLGGPERAVAPHFRLWLWRAEIFGWRSGRRRRSWIST